MLNFGNQFPGTATVRLEQNYRSTKRILRASNALVANNVQRLGKNLFTEGESGRLPIVFAAGDDSEEANFVTDSIQALVRQGTLENEIAVLYRINAQSRVLEEALVRSGIPYSIRGGRRFYERPEVARIVDGLRVLANPDNPQSWQSFLRRLPGVAERRASALVGAATHEGSVSMADLSTDLVGVPHRAQEVIRDTVTRVEVASRQTDPVAQTRSMAGLFEEVVGPIGTTSLEVEAEAANVEEFLAAVAEYIAEYAGTVSEFLDRVSLFEPGRHSTGVQLMTLHAAKGLEFDAVFITGTEDGLVPHSRALGSRSADLEEERRLLYVGMTRARRTLHLSYSHSRTVGGRHGPTGPSRFLQEIPRQLIEVAHGPKRSGRMRLAAVKVDERVRHARWGEGKIERVEGKGHGTMVSILFIDGTRQRIQLCHAPLQRVAKGAG
jgi:DNA helicase-2/ATP-dependent DNA helicase PcrA